MSRWQRKRQPDEVPTPVAVALSDFCRRADAPAPAGEVRAALALISDDEDFRVRELAEKEPPARPLGPHAAIDLLWGAAPELAAQRQACGYYELARELSDALTLSGTQIVPAPTSAPLPRKAEKPPAPAKPAKAQAPAAESVSARIAPRKRTPAPQLAQEPPPAGPAARERPKPRGRFTQLSAQKLPSEELFEHGAAELLAGLVEQHPHRLALQRVLSEQYASRGRDELSLTELVSALERHGLLERLAQKERELVLGSYTEHRGASGRVAWALGLRPPELAQLVRMTGLAEQVEARREHFRREALAPKNLTARLDLLGRTRYLADLEIAPRFRRNLAKDLTELLEPLAAQAATLEDLAGRAGMAQGAPPELILRAIDKLGLEEPLRRRIAAHPSL